MIGLGVDLCQIDRIEAAIRQNGRFLERYYSAQEREYLAQRGQAFAQSAAGMFAAKEAFLKALGVGLSGGVAMADVSVIHDSLGCPAYAPGERARAALEARGARAAHLSISHDAGVAVAVCVLDG